MASSNAFQTRTREDLSVNESNLTTNDDYLQDNTPLIIISEKPYRRIRTSPFIFFHMIVTILLEIVIVGLPIICDIREKWDFCPIHSSYNIALYVHAGAYLINLLFDRIYHYYQDLSRRDGYLEFYRRTRNLRRTPLIIISAGNALLVAMIKLLEDYSDKISPMKPEYCLAILTTIEMLIIFITLIWYFVVTIGFNKKRARPDATNEDFLSTFVPPTTSANEVGFRDETYREDVLTKQAELIRYLRERNVQLSRLLVQIQNPNNPTNVIHRRV